MVLVNGQIPATGLKKLSTVGSLVPAAANSYERMRKAAAKDGVDLRPTSAADAYRVLATQVEIFLDRYVKGDHQGESGFTTDRRIYRGFMYTRRTGTAPAAIPGTSDHGLGVAVDFRNAGSRTSEEYRWLKAHGAEYGWDNAEGSSIGELWHWVYTKAHDKHRVTYAKKVTTKRTIARATPGGKHVKTLKKRTKFLARKGSRTKDTKGREWIQTRTKLWVIATKTNGRK